MADERRQRGYCWCIYIYIFYVLIIVEWYYTWYGNSLVEWSACTDSLLRAPTLRFSSYTIYKYIYYIFTRYTNTVLATWVLLVLNSLNEVCSLFPHFRRRLARIVPRSCVTIRLFDSPPSPHPTTPILRSIARSNSIKRSDWPKSYRNDENGYEFITRRNLRSLPSEIFCWFLSQCWYILFSIFTPLFFVPFLFYRNTRQTFVDRIKHVWFWQTAVGPPVYEWQAKPANWEISSKISDLGKWLEGRRSVLAASARFSSRSPRRKATLKWRSYVPKTWNRNRALKPFQVRCLV